MKKLILFFIFLCSSNLARAQEITAQPICFTLKNEAPYAVYGNLRTDYFTAPDGSKQRHEGSFRLQAKGTEPDKAEFCSSGPFFAGRQLELVIRTLIPIFSCKTNIEMGEIIIKGEIKPDGTTRTYAVCY